MISPERRMLLAGPAEAARRLGVSVKALRLYEQRGLVTPKRTRQGWRYFDADDLDRLSRALAFKSPSSATTVTTSGRLAAVAAGLSPSTSVRTTPVSSSATCRARRLR